MDDKPPERAARTKPGLTGGLILILLGALFLLVQADRLGLTWANWWTYFLVGLGAILILTGLLGLRDRPGESLRGRLIGGLVLIIVGAVNILGVTTWWPAILVVVGLALVISSLFARS
jgi:hypothetical protein